MEYRKFDKIYYIRVDKGEEIISSVLRVCRTEKIASAVFSGIGGCSSAEIQTFIPENGTFDLREISGMLELVSMNGSVTVDGDGNLFHHTHASFAYVSKKKHCMAAGHIRSTVVRYTAEIELRPVIGGTITRKTDPETKTGFWDFSDKEISVKPKLSDIFEDKPDTWGYRGDPYFWAYLKDLSEGMEVLTEDGLEEWIKNEFFKLSGKKMSCGPEGTAVIEQFAHGGMSSGGVDGQWWQQTGIPLLKERIRNL